MGLAEKAAVVRRDEQKLERDRAELYARIRAEREAGKTLRAIASETGITYARVFQILQKKD